MRPLALICLVVGLLTAITANPASAVDLLEPPTPALEGNRDAYDVTPQLAEENLAIQNRGTRVDIVEQLRARLGDDYAGIWFDNQAGEFVVPISTAGLGPAVSQGRAAAVAAEFAAASLEDDFRVNVVAHSREELEAAQLALDQRLSAFFEEGLAQTALDPSVNAVVVRVPFSIDAASLTEIERSLEDPDVKVEIRQLPDAAFQAKPAACNEATRLCDLPLRGGAFIYGGPFSGPLGEELNEICSAGFRANGYDGKRYIVTAGHCVKEGAKPNGDPIWPWFTTDTGGYRHSIGTTSQWHYPGKDWAKIDAAGSWADTPPWPTILAYWGGSHEYPVWGEAKSYKGQTLCHIGANTGTSCGIVTEENVNVEYYNGAKLNGMFEVRGKGLALAGGDSGGPVVANNIALGITSGGYAAYSDAILYFSDIKAATSELNVNIAGPGAPEVITGSSGSVQPYQALVYGQVNANQLQTYYSFEYGKGGYTNSTPNSDGGAGQGFFSTYATLSDLDPASTYKYRIRASNSLNSAYGGDGTFTTPTAPPKVTIGSPTKIWVEAETGKAVLNGTVNPGGAGTSYRFEWGTSESYGDEAQGSAGSGITSKTVEVTIGGLLGSKTYYYRLVAENEKGVAEAKGSFVTPDWRPVVNTWSAQGAGSGGKTALGGTVNPMGFATTFRIEWGTQAEFEEGKYGHVEPWLSTGSSQSAVNVSQWIEGLKQKSTYHFRLVAENPNGVTYGADKSFTTPNWEPWLYEVSPHAVDVGSAKATLTGAVNPRGFPTTYHFEWGDTTAYGNSIPLGGGSAGSENAYTDVATTIEGLLPRRTYHYRLVAKNAEGTTTTGDYTFTTDTSQLVGDKYPIQYVGVATPDEFSLVVGSTGYSCAGMHVSADSGSATAELATSWSNPTCYAGGQGRTLNTNGCKLSFDPGHGQDGVFGGEIDIGPPGCGPMTMSAQANCTLEIGAQTGLPAEFRNVKEAAWGDMAEIQTKGSFLRYNLKGILCSSEVRRNGSLLGTWKLKGYDAFGEPRGLRVDPGGNGFFIGGAPPQFQAESYPTELSGGQEPAGPFKLHFNGTEGDVTCGIVAASASRSGPAASVPIAGKFSNCSFGSGSATIAMNSCSFQHTIANGGPPYTGGFGVTCNKVGDAIEVDTPNCLVKIFAHNPSTSTVQYENSGTGSSRTVKFTTKTTELQTNYKGKICIFLGEKHTASLDWASALRGN